MGAAHKIVALTLSAAVCLVAAGCGGQGLACAAAETIACDPSEPTPSTTPTIHVGEETNRAKRYRSISELNTDSEAVVIVTATDSARTKKINKTPVTLQTVTVVQLLRGNLSGDIIVRASGATSDGTGLTPGKDYLLFLSPFEASRGTPLHGQWIGTGGPAGTFMIDGDDVVKTDTDSPDIPERTALTEVEELAGRWP